MHWRHCNGRQGSPRFKGDPRVGWDDLEPNRPYLSNFLTWYSKSGNFPIEIPIKNKKWPLNFSYGSIILKIVLWAHFTITHAMLLKRVKRLNEKSSICNRLVKTCRLSSLHCRQEQQKAALFTVSPCFTNSLVLKIHNCSSDLVGWWRSLFEATLHWKRRWWWYWRVNMVIEWFG